MVEAHKRVSRRGCWGCRGWEEAEPRGQAGAQRPPYTHTHTCTHTPTEPRQWQCSPSECSTQSHPRGPDTCRAPQPPGQKPSPPLRSPTRRGRRGPMGRRKPFSGCLWKPLIARHHPVNPVGGTQWERPGRWQDPGLGKQTGSGGRRVGVGRSFDEGAVARGVPRGQYYLLVNWASG